MVRQAHTYLVGAVSGVTLIAIAIAAFVLLVSAQVFTDWPIPGSGDDEAAVSTAQPVGSGAEGPASTAGPPAQASQPPPVVARKPATAAGGAQLNGSDNVQPGSTGSGGPSAGAGEQGGSGNAPSAQGSRWLRAAAKPSSPASAAAARAVPAPPPRRQQVTTTVNETVNKVDETALGGALGNTGVTGVTEEAVNGLAGPESTVGKASTALPTRSAACSTRNAEPAFSPVPGPNRQNAASDDGARTGGVGRERRPDRGFGGLPDR